ncbi:hypothetical protein BT63DRAFT_425625 [Microthyrium microscopicum]|uniref:Uncharacterized protein n=1 Tax=Microthyrium microscopicum TaxID=703497 RepID=A0A6A6UAG5_9PEZI|nr:hypothetical protein BT63DRAFT_425625 [Microthyrium microscopicum]
MISSKTLHKQRALTGKSRACFVGTINTRRRSVSRSSRSWILNKWSKLLPFPARSPLAIHNKPDAVLTKHNLSTVRCRLSDVRRRVQAQRLVATSCTSERTQGRKSQPTEKAPVDLVGVTTDQASCNVPASTRVAMCEKLYRRVSCSPDSPVLLLHCKHLPTPGIGDAELMQRRLVWVLCATWCCCCLCTSSCRLIHVCSSDLALSAM